MPNDPSIPLGVDVAPPKFNTPFEQLGQVYALRGAKLNQDLTQQEINTGQSLEDERRRKTEHARDLQLALQHLSGSGKIPTVDEMRTAIGSTGEDPEPFVKEYQESDKRLMDLQAARTKQLDEETNIVAERASQWKKDGYQAYHIAFDLARLEKAGIDVAPIRDLLKAQPERTQEVVDALAQSNKQQKVADDAQAAADEHAAAPGKIPDPVTGLTPSQTATNTRELERIALEKKRLAQDAAKAAATDAGAVIKPIEVGTPDYKVAQDLAFGHMTPAFFRTLQAYNRDANKKAALYAKAAEINPNFNEADFERGFKFISNTQTGRQLSSIDNALSGVPDLLSASDAAQRSGAKIINQYVTPAKIAFGSKKFSNLRAAQLAWADEVSGALGFGSATDMKLQLGIDLTDKDLSPENFKSAIQTIVVPFLERKQTSMLKQASVYGTPENNSSLAPSTRATGASPGASGPVALPPVSERKAGVTTAIINGVEMVWQGSGWKPK